MITTVHKLTPIMNRVSFLLLCRLFYLFYFIFIYLQPFVITILHRNQNQPQRTDSFIPILNPPILSHPHPILSWSSSTHPIYLLVSRCRI